MLSPKSTALEESTQNQARHPKMFRNRVTAWTVGQSRVFALVTQSIRTSSENTLPQSKRSSNTAASYTGFEGTAHRGAGQTKTLLPISSLATAQLSPTLRLAFLRGKQAMNFMSHDPGGHLVPAQTQAMDQESLQVLICKGRPRTRTGI